MRRVLLELLAVRASPRTSAVRGAPLWRFGAGLLGALALLVLSCSASEPAAAPRQGPGSASSPSTTQVAAEVLDLNPARCGECHAEAYGDWRESRHAKAYIDGVFLHEFNPSRQIWCVTCHAPSVAAPQKVHDDDPVAQQGVGCLACHERDGVLVSLQKAASSPHQTKVDPTFGSPSFCRPCHDFNFPILDRHGAFMHFTPLPMQETWRQYQANKVSVNCDKCHDPHRAPGAHQVEKLRAALSFAVCLNKGSLQVGINNKGAGHNVPSGGIDRHMMLRVWREPAKTLEAKIGRDFVRVPTGGKRVIFDNTIAPGAWRWFTTPLSALGGARSTPIKVELRYIYAPDESLVVPNATIWQSVFSREVLVKELPSCDAAEPEPALLKKAPPLKKPLPAR